ncbi:MAG TPA: hypothetical protein V6D12_14060 [Candidatus Obscuribacterales bacterium]
MKLKSNAHLNWLLKNQIARDDIPKECIPAVKNFILKNWDDQSNNFWQKLQMFNPAVSVLKKKSILRTKEWWLKVFPAEEVIA